MTDHPLSTPDDPHGHWGILRAVRNMYRRQALTLEQAWSLLFQGEDGPDEMPAHQRGPTREVLAELGYREHFVTPVGGCEGRSLWIRPDWLVESIEELPDPPCPDSPSPTNERSK